MNKSKGSQGFRSAWRGTVIAIVVLLALSMVALWDTYASIVSIWRRSDTYAHGFLILPISFYLIWRKRRELAVLSPSPEYPVLLLLAFLMSMWLSARLADVLVVEQLAAVAMMPGVVWLIAGTQVMKTVMFPMAFLIFAVPMGEALVPVMQDFTASFTVKALLMTGVPVFQEGRYFYIPGGGFEVAEACSGVRYLIASVVLGVLYAYLSYRGSWRRLAFVMIAMVAPVIANGMRAFGIVMIAYYSDYTLAVGVDHIIYGWIFFGVVMLLLFWIGNLLRETPAAFPSEDSAILPQAPGSHSGEATAKVMVMATAGALMIAGGLFYAKWVDRNDSNIAFSDFSMPAGAVGWRGPMETSDTWRPVFHGRTSERMASYVKNGKQVIVYIAYYAKEHQDVELINSKNVLFDGREWRRIGETSDAIALPGGGKWNFVATLINSERAQRMVWHWYGVGGVPVTNAVMAKIMELRARLGRSHHGDYAVIVAADYSLNVGEARAVLEDFMAAMLPAIRRVTGMPA